MHLTTRSSVQSALAPDLERAGVWVIEFAKRGGAARVSFAKFPYSSIMRRDNECIAPALCICLPVFVTLDRCTCTLHCARVSKVWSFYSSLMVMLTVVNRLRLRRSHLLLMEFDAEIKINSPFLQYIADHLLWEAKQQRFWDWKLSFHEWWMAKYMHKTKYVHTPGLLVGPAHIQFYFSGQILSRSNISWPRADLYYLHGHGVLFYVLPPCTSSNWSENWTKCSATHTLTLTRATITSTHEMQMEKLFDVITQ